MKQLKSETLMNVLIPTAGWWYREVWLRRLRGAHSVPLLLFLESSRTLLSVPSAQPLSVPESQFPLGMLMWVLEAFSVLNVTFSLCRKVWCKKLAFKGGTPGGQRFWEMHTECIQVLRDEYRIQIHLKETISSRHHSVWLKPQNRSIHSGHYFWYLWY